MNFRINQLILRFKRETATIPFADFTYFYGEMGAGKSSIARLIDYCLGGRLVDTLAIQNEFVWASLYLEVSGRELILTRIYQSNLVRASWVDEEGPVEISIPTRTADGEVLPGTGVEVLSDLIFHLADIKPPRVRGGRQSGQVELVRLSLRDLLWYCYLDQDSIDSGFFNLDGEANPYVRLKSVAVLRYILGYHQERVAELEAKLENIRSTRLQATAGYEAIKRVLTEADLPSELDLEAERRRLRDELTGLERRSEEVRQGLVETRVHASEAVRARARSLDEELADCENAVHELETQISQDKAHRNELTNLGTRFRRAQSARAVLGGVVFTQCPRCSQPLTEALVDTCRVCRQPEPTPEQTLEAEKVAEVDLDARLKELASLIEGQEKEIKRQNRLGREIRALKEVTDIELNQLSKRYDSAYLSQALELEREIVASKQRQAELQRYSNLINRITALQEESEKLGIEESKVRTELAAARATAEQDTQNIQRLKTLFLDCLLRAKIPGFLPNDVVELASPHFLPEIYSLEGGGIASTSFANLGSGGKKTLFKACFAIAIHRLAVERNANLPTLLIIDSPMKNISERVNRQQFEGFHEMLYELAQGELFHTQFVLIDKELLDPPEGFQPKFFSRFMSPDRDDAPPLIAGYRGK